jgi:hypothetical protein
LGIWATIACIAPIRDAEALRIQFKADDNVRLEENISTAKFKITSLDHDYTPTKTPTIKKEFTLPVESVSSIYYGGKKMPQVNYCVDNDSLDSAWGSLKPEYFEAFNAVFDLEFSINYTYKGKVRCLYSKTVDFCKSQFLDRGDFLVLRSDVPDLRTWLAALEIRVELQDGSEEIREIID